MGSVKITRTTLRLPSKATQYGYVEVDVEHENDWHALGHWYREVVVDFQSGETNQAPSPKARSINDVHLPDNPKTSVLEEQFGSSADALTHGEAEELIKSELGATDITEVMKEDVDEEPAPWEKPPAAPSDDDWNF